LREEIRAAIAWSLEQSGQALAETLLTAICPFWIELGFYQELRAWLEQAVMQSPSAPMLLALAQIAARQGEVARSLAYGQQVFDQAFQADDRSMLANGALTVAIAEGRLGNHHRSQAMGELALSSLRELADPARIAEAEAQLAHLALLRGDLGTAQSLAETVLDYRRLTGEPSRAIDMLDLLSLIARLRGDNVRQSALAQQTLELTLLVDNPFMIASGLWTAAAIACERGFYRESARFYGAEGAVRQASGFALDPGHRDEHAASIAAVRTALGVQVFAAEWETGQALGMAALQEAATFLAALAGTERDAYQAEKRALQSLGLSDRQQDVLRLIIQGRSDREIAAMLSISARTVSKHVEAILTRVDARTRSGAAAIAARLTADAQPGTLSPSIEPGQLL
jgi:non-specific serine/threonine protein kinase